MSNPSQGLAPKMSSNESLRRLLSVFQDENGNPRAGAPGGPVQAKSLGEVTRHAAGNPAYQIAQADDKRVGGMLRNLDSSLTVYFGSSPNVDDTTGSTLQSGDSIPINVRGPIYIYESTGAAIVEFTPVFST